MKSLTCLLALFASSAAFSAPIVVDAQAHAVTFEVVSANPGEGATLEFLVAGPGSDHDYEAMFLSVASVAELAKAFDEAGIPRGTPIDYGTCRFWPTGDEIAIEPDVWSFVRDARNERKAPAVYTGGSRTQGDVPDAETTMPLAVFALYDCPQSLVQFNDALSQSATYGRFVSAVDMPQGEKRILTVRWLGPSPRQRLSPVFAPGKLADTLKSLQARSAAAELDVTPVFSSALTVAEAHDVAAALQIVDSPHVKINGFVPGQFFYRSFLPLEKWRDRTQRLTQPYEVRLAEGVPPRLTVIKEDWSDPDSPDPKLLVTENVDFASLGAEGDLTDACLIYAPATMRLEDVFAVRKLLPARVVNYYVYAEQ